MRLPVSLSLVQVLMLYVAGLLERRQQLPLAPQYLPLLREANRQLLAHELLQLLTQRLTSAATPSTSSSSEHATAAGTPAEGLSQRERWEDADALCARVYCSMVRAESESNSLLPCPLLLPLGLRVQGLGVVVQCRSALVWLGLYGDPCAP